MHPLCFLTIISSISLCVHYTLLEFSVYLGWYNYSEIHVFLHFSAFLIYSTIHIVTSILPLNPGNLSKLICSTQLDAHELSHNIISYILPYKYTTCDTLCKKIRKSADFPQFECTDIRLWRQKEDPDGLEIFWATSWSYKDTKKKYFGNLTKLKWCSKNR